MSLFWAGNFTSGDASRSIYIANECSSVPPDEDNPFEVPKDLTKGWYRNENIANIARRIQDDDGLEAEILYFQCSGDDMDMALLSDDDWTLFCEAVATNLPNLRSLFITKSDYFLDDSKWDSKWEELLLSVPNLKSLQISGIGRKRVKTMSALSSLQSLEELTMHKFHFTYWKTYDALARSLLSLPSLRRITLESVNFVRFLYVDIEPDPDHVPPPSERQLLTALNQMSNLEDARFHGLWNIYAEYYPTMDHMQARPEWPLNLEDEYRLQFFPRLNKAGWKTLRERGLENATVEEFVEVLIKVRDRFDCVHYLLSETDNDMWATAAIG